MKSTLNTKPFDKQVEYPACSELVSLKDRCHSKNEVPLIFAEPTFPIFPKLADDISNYFSKNFFGCVVPTDRYYLSIVDWINFKQNWMIDPEWIVSTSGIISSLTTVIDIFSNVGDGVIIQPPVFHQYKQKIDYLNRDALENNLVLKNNHYEVNFVQLEKMMQKNSTKILILCHPQNPTGKVYSNKELSLICKLAQKNNVLIFSDEIFSDMTYEETDFRSLGLSGIAANFDRWIVATSLGKSFGMSGFNHANLIIKNEEIRNTFTYHSEQRGYSKLDPTCSSAVISAYNHGLEWQKNMVKYIKNNQEWVNQFLKTNIPQLQQIASEYSYFAWIDMTYFYSIFPDLSKWLEDESQFFSTSGEKYGENGEGFFRVNLAIPKSDLIITFKRLAKNLKKVI